MLLLRPSSPTARRWLAVLLALLGLAAGLSAAVAGAGAPNRSVWMPAPVTTVARYGFDGSGPAAWADLSGHGHTLEPVLGRRASASWVSHDAGRALRFPERCAGEPCPRMTLRTPSTAALNPGARMLRYGASILLDPRDTSAGQNVLQKGYAAEGSQYKLQIDGEQGQPSCAVVGDGDRTIHLATAGRSVADGAWHRLECRRDATTLTILVDGVAQGRAAVPADLSIVNDRPLSLGGKSAYGDNDQYHGLLDDVWIATG